MFGDAGSIGGGRRVDVVAAAAAAAAEAEAEAETKKAEEAETKQAVPPPSLLPPSAALSILDARRLSHEKQLVTLRKLVANNIMRWQ